MFTKVCVLVAFCMDCLPMFTYNTFCSVLIGDTISLKVLKVKKKRLTMSL